MKIIFGTQNPAKLKQLQSTLAPLNIAVTGLPEGNWPEIAEIGKTALENAKNKAKNYAKLLHLPVISMDNALYFNQLAAEQQPGPQVRRLPHQETRASDQELIAYYSQIIASLGKETSGYWEYALSAYHPDGQEYSLVFRSPRRFSATPCSTVMEGYPLESLQLEKETGKYIAEMTEIEKEQFWQKNIGQEVQDFIKSLPNSFFLNN